jgi:hypothetical protein
MLVNTPVGLGSDEKASATSQPVKSGCNTNITAGNLSVHPRLTKISGRHTSTASRHTCSPWAKSLG